ncbi:hypothetical protein ACVWZK_003075 [Bradyrhizobium sp. GM0.4]
MSLQDDNKAIVGQWFDRFWGKSALMAAWLVVIEYRLHTVG